MTEGKTDLKNDLGNKSSSLRPVDLWRCIFVYLLVRTFWNPPNFDLSIPPTYQQTLFRCASDIGFLWETSQSAMVLSPEFLDWHDDRHCVKSYDMVNVGTSFEWRIIALPPDTRMLRPLVSNVAVAFTSF